MCCFVDMKGLIHQHTTMPSITAADSESEEALGERRHLGIVSAIVLGREELDNECAG